MFETEGGQAAAAMDRTGKMVCFLNIKAFKRILV